MDIGEILSSLNAQDMENLQNIAKSLMSDNSVQANADTLKQPTASEKPIASYPLESTKTSAETEQNPIDFGALGNIAGLMSKLGNTGNDPRCQLISALKPMLSPEKRKRADEAVRIIKLIDILPVLKDSGLLKGGSL